MEDCLKEVILKNLGEIYLSLKIDKQKKSDVCQLKNKARYPALKS